MATHSSILAKRIPMDRGAWWATVHRSQRVRHNRVNTHTSTQERVSRLNPNANFNLFKKKEETGKFQLNVVKFSPEDRCLRTNRLLWTPSFVLLTSKSDDFIQSQGGVQILQMGLPCCHLSNGQKRRATKYHLWLLSFPLQNLLHLSKNSIVAWSILSTFLHRDLAGGS